MRSAVGASGAMSGPRARVHARPQSHASAASSTDASETPIGIVLMVPAGFLNVAPSHSQRRSQNVLGSGQSDLPADETRYQSVSGCREALGFSAVCYRPAQPRSGEFTEQAK